MPTDEHSQQTSLATSELNSEFDEAQKIDLKNLVLAGLLAWIVPGLGHFYQKRFFKACLFFLCIAPTFVVGCLLGSHPETGMARNVYWSWRPGDKRLFFIPQACIGVAAIPAKLQSMWVNAGQPPLFGRFMAPPQLDFDDKRGVAPTQAEIAKKRPYMDLGLYITMIAGLMNLLAFFDVIDGPLVYREEKEKKSE